MATANASWNRSSKRRSRVPLSGPAPSWRYGESILIDRLISFYYILFISGYSCEDHFHESDTFLHSWEVLLEIMTAPLTKDILIDIGMPVMHKNVAYNCRVIFLNQRIVLIRPKLQMCDTGNYRESRWFSSWKKVYLLHLFWVVIVFLRNS